VLTEQYCTQLRHGLYRFRNYCSFAYSPLACFRIGTSGSHYLTAAVPRIGNTGCRVRPCVKFQTAATPYIWLSEILHRIGGGHSTRHNSSLTMNTRF